MPWSPLPTPDGDGGPGPSPLSSLLDSVMNGLGAPSVQAIVLLHERWDDVVGAEVAEHARPVAIEDGHLRIDVDGPAWASHLRWAQREIVARAADLVGPGEIRSVSVRVARR